MEKSADALRTIGEVADQLQTPAHVLRFWESRFPQIKPIKRAGGRRYYRPADVALLTGIRHLLHDEGMTIRGVQKILREQGVRHVASLLDPETERLDAAFDATDMQVADAADQPAAAPVAEPQVISPPDQAETMAETPPMPENASPEPAPVTPMASHPPDAPVPRRAENTAGSGPPAEAGEAMALPHATADRAPADAPPVQTELFPAQASTPETAIDSPDSREEPDAAIWLPTLLRGHSPQSLSGAIAHLRPLQRRLTALRDRMVEASRVKRN
ncbi:MAG: MerR family transcriptional regulator [Pseudorhodobacter sp.]|nr:MerR family transcriptional regulator [Pseudorhodobacter sp.]